MPKGSPVIFRVLAPIVVVVLLAAAVLFVLPRWLEPDAGTSGARQKIAVGEVLTGLKFTDLEGKTYTLDDFGKELYLINFWASWCPPCLVEMPSMEKLRSSFVNQGFEVLAVDVEEGAPQQAPPVVKRLGLSFPIFHDPENYLGDLFDITALPYSAIVDRKGEILLLQRGERDWNTDEIRNKISKWLSDRK